MNQNLLSSWARLHRRAVAPARSAGTVMLLVVGVLLLVLIVGMTYMHVVQEDRRAGLTVDIDAIVLAQADLVSAKLLEDLAVGPTGQHFADINTNGTTNGTPDGIPDQEPYDYAGDEDKWLAAGAPGGTNWSQVSMLGEGFWNGTNSTDTTRTLTATNAVGAAKSSNGAADATGDGIMDAKPEQAAIFSRGGLLFFAWSRVEDMSSKANINVWHSQVSSTAAYNATTNAPRWWYPGELDLGGFANYFPGVDGTQYGSVMNATTGDLRNLIAMRGVNTALPTPWGDTAGYRRHSWLLNGKYYENPQAPYAAANNLHLDSSGAFDPTNELELRYRNGLVYLDSEAPIEASGRARNLLRGNITSAETAWNDGIPGVSTIANFFTNEPRHQLTTYSGASIYRMPISGDTSTPFWGKRDINGILTGTNPAATLSTEISRVYSAGTPSLPPSVTTVAQLSDQLAVNIIDYADTDNIVTVHNGRYGMEALPFIAETYLQIAYNVTSHNNDGPSTWTGCVLAAQQPAYAIEIRNPFRKTISLANVQLVVNNVVWGTLDVLAGTTTLAPDKPLILYRNSATDPSGDVTTQFNTSLTPVTVAITNAWPTGAGLADMVIKLQVKDSGGNWVDYQSTPQKVANTAYAGPVTVTDAADPIGSAYHRQVFSKGNANGINAIAVTSTDFVVSLNTFAYKTYDTTSDSLGQTTKAGGPANKCVPANNQFAFSDLGGVVAVNELFHIPVIGPTATLTVADVWDTATAASDFMLDPAATALVAANADYQVPHAVLLADRLTTLSPREDGVNNDGDGSADNAEELFVPGTLNINTAPKFLLERVIPIGSSSARIAYIDALRAYRDTPNTTNRTAANYRNGRKGIAYVSEVYNLSSLAAGNDFGRNSGDDYNGTSFGSIQGDFLSNPATGADTIVDDAEEKSLFARWLGQTCSTRSDIYCAYILVRGYTPGNLTTPVTERRAAVLLDRSRVAAQDDGVRVLGVIWY